LQIDVDRAAGFARSEVGEQRKQGGMVFEITGRIAASVTLGKAEDVALGIIEV
jgi:hypothetical protein